MFAFCGLLEKFFDSVAVLVGESTTDAVGEQSADGVFGDIFAAVFQEVFLEFLHARHLRAIRNAGNGIDRYGVDGFQIVGVCLQAAV